MATLQYFGKLMDVAGTASESLALPAGINDTESLRRWLDRNRGWNGALNHDSVRIVLNDEICLNPTPISDSDDIAFLPPVGGG